jgi:hypothetical protein
MNNQQLTPEQNYQVLLDALKYTSDIVVTLTEKNTLNENKISNLEKTVLEQKNLINKNTKLIEELGKKILLVEKNITTSINKDLLIKKNNSKSSTDLFSKSLITNSKIEFEETNFNEDNEDFDEETINNTINNTNLLSEVTSFNLEDIEKFKKQKTATSLVENLIKRKQELENKINDLTSNPDLSKSSKSNKSNNNTSNVIIIEEDKENELSKDSKTVDLNAIRRKKNFARKF